jgi:hypothetical protein
MILIVSVALLSTYVDILNLVNPLLAPEMIVGSGHDHTLDWWALGILM